MRLKPMHLATLEEHAEPRSNGLAVEFVEFVYPILLRTLFTVILYIQRKMTEDTVQVAVRIRPLINSEVEKGCQVCLDVVPGEPQICIRNTDKAFTFNHVFNSETTQEDFYNKAIKGMVTNIFKGYNVTILAYGQTGSGKTHSMGTDYTGVQSMGIIPRAVHDIFDIAKSKEDWEFNITVSFIELYQEQLYDLLSDKQRSNSIVDLREDNKGVKVVGVTEKSVSDAKKTLQYLTQGSSGRATGATAMNAVSSRSHAIFSLSLHQKRKDDPNTATTAKFHLVDLAGSERSKKTLATGERFKEGVNINKGLLALGNVISQLGEGNSATYIGYRDSKLTRLLQDSLGGNSMTLMVACVSPADYNVDETLSTLRYADRARKIKNKPIINQDPQIFEINRLNKLVKQLQLELMGQVNNVSCSGNCQEHKERIESLQKKVRDLTERLNANLIEIVFMHEKAELAEHAREKIQNNMAEILEKFEELLKLYEVDSSDSNTHRTKLESIYLKILDIQKEQKKSSEELLHLGVSLGSAPSRSIEDEEHVSSDEKSIDDASSLHDIDEKHEEHTLRQSERNDEVQNINRELAIKENLVSELLKNSMHVTEHFKDLQELEREIKTLQAEKEELSQALRNAHSNAATSKLAETRRKKVQELEKKIGELSRQCLEQNRIIKTKEKSEQQIKNLSNEIQTLKQVRIKLVKQMRGEADKFARWKRTKESEVNKLKSQDQRRANEITRLQNQHKKQQNVLRRKVEETNAINKRLKDALEMQKRAIQRREKKDSNKEGIQAWIGEELKLSLRTVDAEYSLQKLQQDKASLAQQLDNLQNNNNANEEDIVDLVEFIELRNNQIADLQQKIVESDQESKAATRWRSIQTMNDAKTALKVLFDIISKDRKEQCAKEELTRMQFLENIEIFQSKNEEQEEHKLRKEVNKVVKLQTELEEYKHRCSELETILAAKNVDFHTPKKPKKSRSTNAPKNTIQENSFVLLSDDSVLEDDVENDPDWRKTPLYNRIQKLMSTRKTDANEYTALKRTSDGDIKCACKTKCTTKICTCRKNNSVCSNCNCNPELCQNKSTDDATQTLFSEETLIHKVDEATKRPRFN